LYALVYCHNKNIVHRDLKEANVLLKKNHIQGEDPSIKVIDFGIASFSKNKNKLMDVCGTPTYMAPEVIKGCYDDKCDIWSLGVMLYIMLCGNMPFSGMSIDQLFYNIKYKEVEIDRYVERK